MEEIGWEAWKDTNLINYRKLETLANRESLSIKSHLKILSTCSISRNYK